MRHVNNSINVSGCISRHFKAGIFRSVLQTWGLQNIEREKHVLRGPARSRRARARCSPRALCSSRSTPRRSWSRRSNVRRSARAHASRRAGAVRPLCCTRRAPSAGSGNRTVYKVYLKMWNILRLRVRCTLFLPKLQTSSHAFGAYQLWSAFGAWLFHTSNEYTDIN